MSPALATVWANTGYTPTADPYQEVAVLFADPDNLGYGSGPYREIGYMQIKLMYPLNAGAHVAGSRAELTRATFYRGASFASGGVTTIIESTPSIGGGYIEDSRWAVVVKIPFFANIT
jgi:hypothetical protein